MYSPRCPVSSHWLSGEYSLWVAARSVDGCSLDILLPLPVAPSVESDSGSMFVVNLRKVISEYMFPVLV